MFICLASFFFLLAMQRALLFDHESRYALLHSRRCQLMLSSLKGNDVNPTLRRSSNLASISRVRNHITSNQEIVRSIPQVSTVVPPLGVWKVIRDLSQAQACQVLSPWMIVVVIQRMLACRLHVCVVLNAGGRVVDRCCGYPDLVLRRGAKA